MRMLAGLLMLALTSRAGAAAKLDEAAARALVDRWQKTQNAQDFAGYQALYAHKFDGIKRAGARTRTFDRAGWMADRQKMFAKPMTVATDKLTVEVLPAMARVRFVQSFTLGRFHDEGPKELLLVLESGRPVIAREEMLASMLRAPPVAKETGDLFMVPGGVLLPMAADDAWGSGPPHLIPSGNDDVYAATRPVDTGKVPAEVREWQGRTVSFVGGCTTRIRSLALLVRADPHFSTTRHWEGQPEGPDEPPSKPLSAAAIARELWTMAPVELVGVLDKPCADARWGTSRARPPVAAVVKEVAPTDPLGRAAVALMRKHPAYAKLQTEYARAGAWEEVVKLSQIDGAGQSLLMLSASRFEGCADFGGGLTFVFSRGPNGKLTLLNAPGNEEPWTLDEAADLDGDGTLELLGTEMGVPGGARIIERRQGTRYGRSGKSGEAQLDCYC